MIREEDFNKELGDIQRAAKQLPLFQKLVLKAFDLICKMVRDMRSNQVSIMRKIGAELRKPINKKQTKYSPVVNNNNATTGTPAEKDKNPEKEV